MKKILIFISLLFILPQLVLADMAGPILTTYEVRITATEGIEVYKYNKDYELEKTRTLKYDDVFTINREELKNNELYGYNYQTEEYIKLSDTVKVSKKIDKEKLKKEFPIKKYVFSDNAYLYNGPSKTYGKIEPETKLPIGMEFETYYYDDLWAYVTYNGISGWVFIYTYEEATPYGEISGIAYIEEEEIMTLRDINIIESPITEKKTDIIIPKHTKLKTKYSYSKHPKSTYYYVTYNGINGWIESNDIATKENKYTYVALDGGINLYKDYNSNNNFLEKIPFGQELEILYGVYPEYGSIGSYYVNYKGNEGWISGYNYELLLSSNYPSTRVLKQNKLHEKPNIESKIKNNNIPVNSEVNIKYEIYKENKPNWYFIEYNGETGWVEESYFNEKVEVQKPIEDKPESEKPVEKEKLNSQEIIIVSVLSAVSLSLCAFVTILLINKRKKHEKNK